MTANEKRTVLLHLNVEVPADDPRNADEIGDALMAAVEVGSDDEAVYHLKPVLVMAEEI